MVTVSILSSGCASPAQNKPQGNTRLDHDLIYGVSLFGPHEKLTAAEFARPNEILRLTAEMRAFTRALVRKGLPPMDRAKRLVSVLVRKDFFPKGYYTDDTRTASEVFEHRSGNCLSYTNLFVAMARELDLTAHFQLARVPAAWSADSGFLVRSRHINVLISDTRVPSKDWLTIDFNQIAASTLYPHTPVTDNFALSSFYNNLAVDQLYAGNFKQTVALLAKAIETEPNNADAWVNLSAVYSRNNQLEQAKAAFDGALRAEPGNESALTGMARLHKLQGEDEIAEQFTLEILKRRERDPYFQFATAQAAYEQRAFAQSLHHINRAIELRERGAFYYLQALVYYAQGDLNQASESLVQAQERKRSLPGKKQEHALALASRIHAQSVSSKGLLVPSSQ